MERKTERRLPRWYLDAVEMARDVFTGAPEKVDMRRPAIKADSGGGGGRGVQSQRNGKAWEGHSRPLHGDAPGTLGRRNGLRPPPPSTPLWTPPNVDGDTPSQRTSPAAPGRDGERWDVDVPENVDGER